MTKLLKMSVCAAALCATAFTANSAMARRGADDPAGHVRQCRGCDDAPGDVRRGRGADDAPGDMRRGRGADDAPGDDRGGQGRGSDDPS